MPNPPPLSPPRNGLRSHLRTMPRDFREESMFRGRERPQLYEAPTPIPRQEHPPSKSTSGTRFLALFLRVAVMAFALFFFFLFAGIAALVLIHLFVAGRALRRRGGGHRTSPRHPSGGSGLLPSELKKLPSSRYSAKGQPLTDCAVCLDSLCEGDRARVLPACKHVFHKTCVDRWLIKSAACPICRATVGSTDRGSRSLRCS